ncbi:UvrD-helicase domain-containing protein [Helicobacter sp.]|uniref:ATP-dependent helicase n=1 Tax=Helicobacter sp. TaxID=218 RepID=UPI0025B8F09E|nr:UvrD-helicase domain-containing protein [Helicobacter sp.]MBR2494063.1 UvrD-helicase domain-containing protein [Helicobacter sp.]
MDTLLSTLNPAQAEAAQHIDGALLILAGAGSGKTKTITTRLAYLIKVVGIAPQSTLTLTFTNKAANEMRLRALQILGESCPPLHPPLLCTFHRFGLLFLREHIHHLGRKHDFILLDGDDQKRIVKKLDFSYAHFSPAQILGYISSCKNKLITPSQAQKQAKNQNYQDLSKAYQDYQAFLEKNNMLDFDDLLLKSYEILASNAEIATMMSERYLYIMVDEYQDTNFLQVSLLQKLCTTHNNLCVVGDDDQSIYSWRGADITHILHFAQIFDAKTITLAQNYRSKEPILRAANALIAHNTSRLGKDLVNTRGDGDEIVLLSHSDETQEANTIASKIAALLQNSIAPTQIAILFRLNALSRSIEEGLNRAKIPYKLIGATRFYERAEIKDVLAYFRVVLNLNDDFSLSRIINVPKRSLGKVAQEKIFSTASAHSLSVYEAYKQGVLDSILSPAQNKQLRTLFDSLEILQVKLQESALGFLDAFDESFALRVETSFDDIDRRANIEEFYGYFRDFFMQNPHCGLDDLLYELSLSSSTDVEVGESISCMSVHSSKGLEFEYVFIIGCEEGFFPLLREEGDLQEERRLAYVAFTRAREKLFVSHAHSRFYKGKRETLARSRFIKEAKLLPEDTNAHSDNEPSINSQGLESSQDFSKGCAIKHKIFGLGIVQEVRKVGEQVYLRINFGGNVRLLLADFVQRV